MRHIIVLPYWCDKEIANFLQVLQRWAELCQTDVEYEFLIAHRFDAELSPELVTACEKHAPTKTLCCDRYLWTGWPSGANGMFKHVMAHIAETAEQDGGFVFWFEHDVIPIYADWLTWLHKMWRPDLSMLGQYMSPVWINTHNLKISPHISGSSCYSKALGNNQACRDITSGECFEFTLSTQLPKYGGKLVPIAQLFDLWFFMPDWVKRCDLTKLMINGAKELNQRERVIQYILKNRDT